MGVKNAGYGHKSWHRQSFTVTGVAGDYAAEKITFGAVASGSIAQDFLGVTVLLEDYQSDGAHAGPGLCQAELWLPRVADGTEAASARTDADYFWSGKCCVPAGVAAFVTGADVSYGSATWSLATFPGAQIRVKSGGISGSLTISASAY